MTIHEARAARATALTALGARTFDLVVIGGGITGCGIARDAALRGLDVALVEKDDFASGTSSRSSRLIHGGVRYLEYGHVHLVFESSAERRRLLRLAPHLVHPLAFTWPVYKGARISRWKLAAGLLLYDALSMFRNVRRHRRLNARGVLRHEPALLQAGLKGGAQYYDASTDDARLTLANALDAREAGATVVNHVEARELIMRDGAVHGVVAINRLDGATIELRGRVVVNATGPWSDDIRRLDGSARPAVRGSKGVHIAVPRARIGNQGALTLLSPTDGRVLFVLPAGGQSIVGTTDTYTAEAPDDVRATADDIRYLLDAANSFFPEARLTSDDVVSAWAGIRPLLPTGDTTPGSASREHDITVSAHGLISITGGKLTTYRVMAAEVVDLVLRTLGRVAVPCPTEAVPLFGGRIASFDAEVADASGTVRPVALAKHLVAAHGSRWRDVWAVISNSADGADTIGADTTYTVGELRYAIAHEMTCTPGDFLIRRTHLAFERPDRALADAPGVVAELASGLGWDRTRSDRELADYRREVERMFGATAGASSS